MKNKKKIVRVTTVANSLDVLLRNQLRFINQYFEIVAVADDNERMEIVKEREGVRTVSLPMTRRMTPLKDISAIFKMIKLLKREKPFIVHSHTPKAGLISMIAARIAKTPHRLHTVAGMPLMEARGNKKRLLSYAEKITYKNATLVMPNSIHLKEYILDHSFTDSQKIKIIAHGSSNGIDLDYYSPAKELEEAANSILTSAGITDSDFVFLFIGRLVKDKGVNELLEAFNKLSGEIDTIRLIVVGQFEHDLDPVSANSLDIIKNNKKIILPGYIKDVRPYYMAADAFIFPTYREGFPNVLLQAFAFDLPAVVSDINGCNEIVTHGENGLIIKPKSINDLIINMKELITNHDLRNKLSINCRKSILKYDQQYYWNELLSFYNSLC